MITHSLLLRQDFAYAHGRIGVLQQSMLRQGDIDRLLGTHDFRDADTVLRELPFTGSADTSDTPWTVVLQRVGARVRRDVERMSPPARRPTFSILWLEDDRVLLAWLLKTKRGFVSDQSGEPPVLSPAYDPEDLRTLVMDGENRGGIPGRVEEFVKECHSEPVDVQHAVFSASNATLRQTQGDITPAVIDTRVAAFITDTQLRLARSSGSSMIRRFVRHTIDLKNVRTALRLQDWKEEKEEALLPGGTIDPAALRGGAPAIQAAIDRSPLAFQLTDDLLENDDNPVKLERALSEVIADDVAHLWNVVLGIEPLFAYAALTLSHLRLLRVIMIGKENGMSPQEIKKILPPFIPATHYVL